MKLHWSPRSPYVRKVMILAHETGLAGKLELVRTRVAMTEPNRALLPDNPLGKIPTLVPEEGVALYDSRVICEYLDSLHDGAKMFPQAPAERWPALRRQALGDGMLDALVLWRNEKIKSPERRTQVLLDAFELKISTALPALEKEAKVLAASRLDIGHIAIGCALSYLDFRFSDLGWRTGHPQLAAWHSSFQARASVRQTEPVEEN